ncbi:MAG: undecaprenyl/decaprenyl-phosphate alpha-N-acetylglucosaminyl 1-phosphate transferase [Lentimicrobium sp.]|nr:undecaprenyl/decaprenyl-phosphate alpha-N-acetylglucosaminyl 1-phosphate transferase [Lentimicrobium sp.]
MEFTDFFSGSQTLSLALSFLAATLITALCIPQIIRLSRKYKLVDNPDQRKMHKVPIPTLGGLGFFTGFIVLSLFWMIVLGNLSDFVLFIALLVLFVTGIFDDLTDMRALVKFGIQIVVALIISYFGFRVESLFGIFGIYEMPVWAQYAFSVLLITGLTNAFNLIDGIDGLAGGLAFINSLIMGAILLLQGNVIYGILAISFAGALFGFLIFNFNPAKIFMGDTGSLIVGFLMAIFGIVILKAGAPLHPWFQDHTSAITIVVVGILLLPVYDTLRVFAERILKKSSPFKPDKTHVHHLLIETGANHKKAVFILYTTNILIIVAAFLLRKSDPSFSVLMLFILAAILSESINIKRWFMEIARGKQAMVETTKITSENRFLEDILDESDSK